MMDNLRTNNDHMNRDWGIGRKQIIHANYTHFSLVVYKKLRIKSPIRYTTTTAWNPIQKYGDVVVVGGTS